MGFENKWVAISDTQDIVIVEITPEQILKHDDCLEAARVIHDMRDEDMLWLMKYTDFKEMVSLWARGILEWEQANGA